MLTDRFAEALVAAERLHRKQTRKGVETPYVAHLLAVTATVLEHGANEDVAIAALLHDAVEDHGGHIVAEELRSWFGDRVADLVLGCSDSTAVDAGTKLPWMIRKQDYIAHLAEADADLALIVAADKLHNITATIRDLRRDGLATLDRFSEPKLLVWYYRGVAEALARHQHLEPLADLRVRVEELAALIGGGPASKAGA